MNIVDLILNNPKQANTAIAGAMQSRVFDYLDNYQLDELSKATLGSYIRGATTSKDAARAAVKSGDYSKQTAAKSAGIALKRITGIKNAKIKLISK